MFECLIKLIFYFKAQKEEWDGWDKLVYHTHPKDYILQRLKEWPHIVYNIRLFLENCKKHFKDEALMLQDMLGKHTEWERGFRNSNAVFNMTLKISTRRALRA